MAIVYHGQRNNIFLLITHSVSTMVSQAAQKSRSNRYVQAAMAVFLVLAVLSITPSSIRIATVWKHTEPARAGLLHAHYFHEYASQRVKIELGPYSIPAFHHSNGMFKKLAIIPVPCQDCLITFAQAGLEYTNGSVADLSTDVSLHHSVLTNINANSVVCPSVGEKFFASGNERTSADFSMNGTRKAGYYLDSNFEMGVGVEIMNRNLVSVEVVFTVTFEFIPGPVTADFQRLKVLWFDVGPCGVHELPVPPQPTFTYESKIWTNTDIEGQIMLAGGHEHKGGSHLVMRKNDQEICNMQARYDQQNIASISPDIQSSRVTGQFAGLSICTDIGRITKGDNFSVSASYDTSQNHIEQNYDGTSQEVMGIALAYVATD